MEKPVTESFCPTKVFAAGNKHTVVCAQDICFVHELFFLLYIYTVN